MIRLHDAGSIARVRALFAVALALLLVTCARRAEANSPAPFRRPTGAVPGIVIERTSLTLVEREDLVIDCAKDETPIHPDCTFVATYHLRNPTDSEEELLGAFYTAERTVPHGGKRTPPPIAITFDGADAHAEATPEQVERMDAIVRKDPTIQPVLDANKLDLRRQAFRIRVAAGSKGTLVFQGALDPIELESTDSSYGGYSLPAIYARHPLFGPRHQSSWQGSADEFFYLISPIRGWAGDPEIHVSIRHRSENDFEATGLAGRFAARREGNVTTQSIVVRASSGQNLRFRLAFPEPFIHNGGPLIGLGTRLGRTEFRMRVGYELGLSNFMILGAVAETNFRDFLTAALTLEAATPVLAIIVPSLSFGAGPAVQFREDTPTRVGGRAQIGISWPILGLSFPIDVYPRENSSGSHVEGALVVRLSF